MLMDRQEIKKILPHRDPFLLVDGVLALESGKSIVAVKYVEEEEAYFRGQFPLDPVMPGVLQVEALAQAGAIAVLSLPENKGKIAYFAGIKDAKFRHKVVPGDTLVLKVQVERLRQRGGTGICTAYVGEEVACCCQILFMLEK